jgi:TRAP-type C4-dicarboxylate transport system substrate-binding protein
VLDHRRRRITRPEPFTTAVGRPGLAQNAGFTLKWANNIPLTHPSNIHAREAVDAIKRETNGRVDIQIFPNNQPGAEPMKQGASCPARTSARCCR